MNDALAPSAGLVGSGFPAPKPNVNIQGIDNGFLLSYWDQKTGNHTFHCANIGLVKEQLESIFDTN